MCQCDIKRACRVFSAGRRLRGARQRDAFIARRQKATYFGVPLAADVTYPMVCGFYRESSQWWQPAIEH